MYRNLKIAEGGRVLEEMGENTAALRPHDDIEMQNNVQIHGMPG